MSHPWKSEETPKTESTPPKPPERDPEEVGGHSTRRTVETTDEVHNYSEEGGSRRSYGRWETIRKAPEQDMCDPVVSRVSFRPHPKTPGSGTSGGEIVDRDVYIGVGVGRRD